MTEQERITTPSESAPTSTAEEKPAQKSKSPKKVTAKTAKKAAQKTSFLTDEQKRLARNAALRDWRKKNADRVKAYMTEWRAKRKGEQPVAAEVARGAATQARATGPTKKSSSKTKKGRKA